MIRKKLIDLNLAQKAIPPQKWEDVRPAVDRANACVPHARPLTKEERMAHPPYAEDCLYLDLIAPHRASHSSSSFFKSRSSSKHIL